MKVLCSKIKLHFYKSLLPTTASHFNVKHTLWAIYVFNIALLNRGDQTHCRWEFFPISLNSQLNLLGREGPWWFWQEYWAQWGWLRPISKAWPHCLSLYQDRGREGAVPAFHVVHGPWGNKDWLISTCTQKLECGPVNRGDYLCLILG